MDAEVNNEEEVEAFCAFSFSRFLSSAFSIAFPALRLTTSVTKGARAEPVTLAAVATGTSVSPAQSLCQSSQGVPGGDGNGSFRATTTTTTEMECSDHGMRQDGVCVCDMGFKGHFCEVKTWLGQGWDNVKQIKNVLRQFWLAGWLARGLQRQSAMYLTHTA